MPTAHNNTAVAAKRGMIRCSLKAEPLGTVQNKPQAEIPIPTKLRRNRIGGSNGFEGGDDETVCAVVVIDRATVCGVAPGVIVAEGENEADAPGGNGATLNVIGFANDPFEGATVKSNTAVCPAFTVTNGAGAATE